MKIDWSKFKKIRSDEKTTTLKHPAGHEVVIAHKALSGANRKELDKIPHNYADGGEVQDDKASAAERLNISPQKVEEMEKYPVPPAQQDSNFPKDVNPDDIGRNLAAEPLRTDQVPTAEDSSGGANTSAGLTQATPAPAPVPSLSVAPNDPWGRDTQLKGVLGGEQQQEQGMQQQAALEGAQGRVKATQELAHGQAIQKLNDNFVAMTKHFDENQQNLLKDFEAGHINPNHLFESKNGLSKVTSAIGLILGGMGGGITGQGNPALDFLNKQIDRDIDAQKQNQEGRKTLFGANMQLYGNEKDAYVATKAAMTDLYAHLANSTAAQAAGPMAQARANQLAGALKAQVAPQVGGMLQNQAILKTLNEGQAGGGQGGNNGLDPAVALRLQKMGGLISPEEEKGAMGELKSSENMTKARDNLLGAFDQINKLNTPGNRALSPIQSTKQIDAIKGPLLAQLVKDSEGRITPQDTKMIEGLLGGNVSDTMASEKTQAVRRAQLEKFITQKMNYPSLRALHVKQGVGSRYDGGGDKKIKLGPPVK